MSIPTITATRSAGDGASMRRSVSTLVRSPSPFANIMAQESQARAKAMHVTAAPDAVQKSTPSHVTPNVTPNTTPNVTSNVTPGMQQAHAMAQAQIDRKRSQALHTLTQSMQSGDSPLDAARNAVTLRNARSVMGGFNLQAPATPMSNSIKGQALQKAKKHNTAELTVAMPPPPQASHASIGKLAAQFESGSEGIAAIGYDRHGGTSYGKYQIASRVGSMTNFLNFLDTAAPDMAKQLRSAGPANTGSRQGAMPDMWRKIAAAQPERFEALQEKFIYDSHYKPALEAVTARTPLSENSVSSVMQEVIWSTAVQHGPAGAARIFSRAAEQLDARGASKQDLTRPDTNYDKQLIDKVYAIRAEQFGSSTEQVQLSVRNRMRREKNLALNMLESKKATV